MNGYYNRWAVCVCHVQLTKMPFQKNVCLIYLLCTLKMSRHLLKTIIFLLVSFTSFLFHSFIGSTILRGQNVEFHHWPLSAPVSAVIRSALHPLIHSLNPMCQQTFRTCIIFNDYTYWPQRTVLNLRLNVCEYGVRVSRLPCALAHSSYKDRSVDTHTHSHTRTHAETERILYYFDTINSL